MFSSFAVLEITLPKRTYALLIFSTNPSVLNPVTLFESGSTMGFSEMDSDSGELPVIPFPHSYMYSSSRMADRLMTEKAGFSVTMWSWPTVTVKTPCMMTVR